MENASKALIMAGGIFLAIIILTLGVYVYTSIHGIANSQDSKKLQEQLVAFNKKYESYNKSIMYGADVITVINMSYDDSQKYDLINVYVDGVLIKKNNLKEYVSR